MYKSYRFRFYPNKKQLELINKTFGSSRYVYNYYLDKMKNKGYVSASTNIKDYTSILRYNTPFLQEVDSIVLTKSIFNLDDDYKKLFNKTGGYPKHKSKNNRNSYNIPSTYKKYKDKEYCNIELDLTNRQIKLPKLKWVKIRGYRNTNNINGKIKNATISREPNGKYYVSILYEMYDKVPIIKPRTIVGIDLGIKKLLTLSDGTVYDNNKYIDKYTKRIKRKQRELSRKEKGSKNYYKCKKELAILYSKLANARKFYTHKITKDITDEYDIITCEQLKTKEMIIKGKDNKLSSKINDATFSEIIRQFQYKARYKGKVFYQINTYYPSSQICSRCSAQDKRYKDLTRREYKCLKCNQEIDRDLNASINIMFEGLKLYMKNYAKI
ncbi:MAG: transposase [Firmicutes bacterium]|nr:transposase [Bacillota bacterium]MDY5335623.1 transposase [Bacilli bacterium]